MITIPAELERATKSGNLTGLKPFALLYRNKWDSVNNVFALESTPIDISEMIVKPNTLSMTLDVNEIAQYNANNVTLTLSDPHNRFIEGVPGSYFPADYQLYGSRVVLYYGFDSTNRISIFTGSIKDLPNHKPEQYQVDLKLVSPLEMLKDIEAKEFSDKVTGETLAYKSTDDEGHRIYQTAGVGVGGFYAVYADGTKLFEGIDYETSQLNLLGAKAEVTIIKSDYYSSTITADYFTWKTNLTVEQIVTGLVGLAGYDSTTEDIRNVVWSVAVRGVEDATLLAAIGYTKNGSTYESVDDFNGGNFGTNIRVTRHSYYPSNCKITLNAYLNNPGGFNSSDSVRTYFVGIKNNGDYYTGVAIVFEGPYSAYPSSQGRIRIIAYKYTNGSYSNSVTITNRNNRNNTNTQVVIEKNGDTVKVIGEDTTATYTFDNSFDFGNSNETNETLLTQKCPMRFDLYKVELLSDDTAYVENKGILVENSTGTHRNWSSVLGYLSDENSQYTAKYRTKQSGQMTNWQAYQLNNDIGINSDTLQLSLEITTGTADIENLLMQYMSNSISFALVSFPGESVLEALQDLALISGYEFGVNRNGVFFFRPRKESTTPTYQLDHSEIVKVDTVKKNLNDFFTKLTLTFAAIPLEVYANEGTRPTLVDRYGVINKEIDKPNIVNYDNPELAQAIGPQLLAIYSALPDTVQATGKLNLALELGDIVNLKRNYPLTADPAGSDYNKFERQNTYYRACKITGLNYNFDKRQITYTLREVTDENNIPPNE